MIATHTDNTINGDPNLDLESNDISIADLSTVVLSNIKSSAAQLLPSTRMVAHHTKAGLNPIADSAAHLLSILGKVKLLKSYRHPAKLQQELIKEMNLFEETIKHHGYNPEYLVVCRYILCATFDDVISNTEWGSQGQWNNLSLLAAFNQDIQHQDKFFTILERSIKDPALYIDLMELMYICLSMGYKGQYRSTEHSQFQLELITNNLYKHIRAHRGSFSKALSPVPLKARHMTPEPAPRSKSSFLFIFFATACIIMIIFVSLGYLTDVISNEAFKNITKIQSPISRDTTA